MKHGLEDVVKKLTRHLEDLKSQMKKQKVVNSDLAKERDFLLRKVEHLEDGAVQRGVGENELVNLRNQLLGKFSDRALAALILYLLSDIHHIYMFIRFLSYLLLLQKVALLDFIVALLDF